MTPHEFKKAALELADRLDATPVSDFIVRHSQARSGQVILPVVEYAPIAAEWIEFLTPFGLGKGGEAYEFVARRGWENAKLIDRSSWEGCMHIASSVARAQRTTNGDILGRAHGQGMLSGLLRQMAKLAETPDGVRHLGHARALFSAADTPKG